MGLPTDTVAAPITGAGRAAVAVIRVSGPKAWQISSQVFAPWPEKVQPRLAIYGRFVTGDDGLALPFPAGGSYTGDETVEFSIHGSPASVKALMESLISSGARLAEPGEFTLRAFLNGRMDLAQAEGVRETVDAITDGQLRRSKRLREGEFSRKVSTIKSQVEGVLARVEASTDFSEEVGEVDHSLVITQCENAVEELDRLLEGRRASRILSGYTVAIAGRPNAGKSSLLNAILGADRAIVTPIAGTTRDTVEETVELAGVPVRFVDTAGLRGAEDEVEAIGIERSRMAMDAADRILYLYDAPAGWSSLDDEILAGCPPERTLIVANKVDLGPPERADLRISAKTGHGVDDLLKAISEELKMEELPMALERHYPLMEEARGFILQSQEVFSQPIPDDLATVFLKSAIRCLGEITGETTPPDVIQRIFSDFCIGK